MESNKINLHSVMKEIGEFGNFQKKYIVLCSIPMIFTALSTFGYVFTAGNLDYRCKIPDCEEPPEKFETNWFDSAIPQRNIGYEKCVHFNISSINSNSTCSFHTNDRITCNDFIYKDRELTVVNEFNITCESNEWKLSLVGTINSLAQFICMPIGGILSDIYGRRNVLVTSIIGSLLLGLLKSFSINYWMFLILEFINGLFDTPIFTSAFILGMEILSSETRVLGATIFSIIFSLGVVLLGIVAMYVQNFRLLLRIWCLLFVCLISYFWILPESLRWLMTHNKHKDIKKILLKAAKENNANLSIKTKELLSDSSDKSFHLSENAIEDNKKYIDPDCHENGVPTENNETQMKQKDLMLMLCKSPSLLLRMLNCSFCWFANAFVYFSLILISVHLTGNKYLNFVLTSLIDIPSYSLCYLILNRIGRKWPLCVSLIIGGLLTIASQYIPSDMPVVILILYLAGKCAICTSYTILYIFATELFPTNLRHTIISTCSMMGALGAMVAPQTPLLAHYMVSLPFLLFGGIAILSGLLSITFPETLNRKLPDTIADAENIKR